MRFPVSISVIIVCVCNTLIFAICNTCSVKRKSEIISLIFQIIIIQYKYGCFSIEIIIIGRITKRSIHDVYDRIAVCSNPLTLYAFEWNAMGTVDKISPCLLRAKRLIRYLTPTTLPPNSPSSYNYNGLYIKDYNCTDSVGLHNVSG